MSERDDTHDAELMVSSSDPTSSAQPTGYRGSPSLQLITSATGSPASSRVTKHSDAPYLRVVPTMPDPAPSRAEPESRKGSAQLPLFPGLVEARPSLLAFLDMSTVSDRAFITMLGEMCPRWLLDLRPAPRFDYGRLNRHLAFRLFSEHGVNYLDIAARLRIRTRHDARLHAGILSQELNALLARTTQTFSGPIVVLLDEPSVVVTALDVLPRTLQPRPKRGWTPRRVVVHGEQYSLV